MKQIDTSPAKMDLFEIILTLQFGVCNYDEQIPAGQEGQSFFTEGKGELGDLREAESLLSLAEFLRGRVLFHWSLLSFFAARKSSPLGDWSPKSV